MLTKPISKLQEVDVLHKSDLLLLETGTNAEKTQYQNLYPNISHNAIFRGKNLGTISSSNIDDFMNSHKVRQGEFTDLYVGDYFTANYDGDNKIFRIAGFDIYLNQGKNNIITDHHLVIVPDSSLGTADMNSTATSGVSQNPNNPVGISASPENQLGAFAGSDMFQLVLPEVNTKLEAIFGNHLLEHEELLSNSIDANARSSTNMHFTGASNNYSWYNVKANLMSEIEVYRSMIFSSSGFDSGTSIHQLPLFRLEPKFININYCFWLKDVARSDCFCFKSTNYDIASYEYAYQSTKFIHIRPKFILVNKNKFS